MAVIIAHARRISALFNKLAHRLDEHRLARAKRELERHRAFLELDRFSKLLRVRCPQA
jgi:hypothetical protein